MEKECGNMDIGAFSSNEYFIDIGIEEDYHKAQKNSLIQTNNHAKYMR